MTRLLTALTIAMLLSTPAASADLYATAKQYIGLHERTNRKSLRKMLGVDPVRVQWCGAFLAMAARKAGYKPPSGANVAASWSRFGRSVSMRQAKRGDVVVMRGHVTVFTRIVKGKVCGVGGNQSNAIKESCYKTSRVVAVRRAR
jgi:uncharacterized protein (TIGR02594 family)